MSTPSHPVLGYTASGPVLQSRPSTNPQLCEWVFPLLVRNERSVSSNVSGKVLEIGFGSGHNLPYYPGQVESVVAIDPSRVSAKLARRRVIMAPFPVEYLPLKGEEIPAAEESFDSVVSTFTLCTIPDVATALWQIRRVLKTDGQFFLSGARPVSRILPCNDGRIG